MKTQIQIECPSNPDGTLKIDLDNNLTVGAACFYISNRKQVCAICNKQIKAEKLVFTYVYESTQCQVRFKGHFDSNCFFQTFRVKSYLHLEGFHSLMFKAAMTI